MCVQGQMFGNKDAENKLNEINIAGFVKLGNLEVNVEQKILDETMRKFYKVIVIRPKAVLPNLWGADLYCKFPQFHAASQQAFVIQPALGYSVTGRSYRGNKYI